MATTISNVLTFAAFERLPDGDGFHRELIEGELQILPPVKSTHTIIAKRVLKRLMALEAPARCQAYPEAGYKLSEDPATWLQPDVSLLSNARVNATTEGTYFIGAPELAVEVVSPSESARDLTRKVSLYLKSGSHAVWIIYPEDRTVQIHRPDGTAYTAETLSIPELLPDWHAPVTTLFED